MRDSNPTAFGCVILAGAYMAGILTCIFLVWVSTHVVIR